LLLSFIFSPTPRKIMIILGITLGLFAVGGGLISLTNALSKRQ
jgi:small neutral amino acid transporter SnatA (MarC family)